MYGTECLFRIETSSTYGETSLIKFVSKMHEKQMQSVIKKIGVFNQSLTIVKFVLEKPGKWF